MTKKLYWNDSRLRHFTARVLDCRREAGQTLIVLDQSGFYPTGGGQPCDTGRIDSFDVVDVEMTEDDRIVHRLKGEHVLAVGREITGQIDWNRRLDMIQQHTGQHILSQAFYQLFGAETMGFRITDRATEIDLTLESHPEEIDPAVRQAEDLANRIVFENREIRLHEVTPEEAAALPLRKESFIADCIRVVEIADYDWSPCGGTHAARTGEVGLIAVRNWERARKMTRVHFVCGARTLRDYRSANKSAESVARKFSVPRDEAEAAVARLLDENKTLTRRVRELAELAAKAEADDLLGGATYLNGARLVTKIFDQRGIEELKLLAHRLVDREGIIALLGSREIDTARLVFARSNDLDLDMSALIKVVCQRLGGRGGGKPDFAQGGGSKIGELQAALESAVSGIDGMNKSFPGSTG